MLLFWHSLTLSLAKAIFIAPVTQSATVELFSDSLLLYLFSILYYLDTLYYLYILYYLYTHYYLGYLTNL